MTQNKIIIQLLVAVWLGLFFTVSQAAAELPEQQVQETVDKVMAVLNNSALDSTARHSQISELIASRFDFEAMSRSILAVNWKKANAEQQAEFMRLFRKILENTYVTAVESYHGETVRVEAGIMSDRRATVNSFIVMKDKEIPVSYRFKHGAGGWQAYDVVIEGVSLISNYRSSFRSIVQKKGMDGLLADMQSKLASSA
ncbi:MAG: ABC transporter substrate-binding protein [gamma proteobacterium symbiont of Bathyaustriella thionipta]|nr:ABC transporter substrate-binding protein [gamma proteobacterium symbiont of Bathyaustriella thionipta]